MVAGKAGSALIIGGTGTLGKEIIRQLPQSVDITVLSRDEQKQQALKKVFPNVKFVLGDIRDRSSIERHFKNKDLVFHVAALKHIDHIEENPIESVKTNILGSINVAECALNAGVMRCMFSSTDKASDPLNVYGNCKAISEKIFLDYNRIPGPTKFAIYRWGNVINSNGSAIPFFIECLKNNRPVPITDMKMTRFWITIETAVRFIMNSMFSQEAETGILIPPMMKSAKVVHVVECLAELLGISDYEVKVVGMRKGEKLHECLTSVHHKEFISSDRCDKYTKAELKLLLKPILKESSQWAHLSSGQKEAWAKDTKPSLSLLENPSEA